jgi:hypothetical protein
MATTVSTTSILGSDSVSLSRTTINSNFLLLENWINGYASGFGIDSTNGVLDLTSAPTGRISAKSGFFDSMTFPAGGTATAQILSSGSASFNVINASSVNVAGAISVSGASTYNSTSTFGATAAFNSVTQLNGRVEIGTTSSLVNKNVNSAPTTGTAVATPYEVTGLESIIYFDFSSDVFLKVADATTLTTASASSLPNGFILTLVNSSTSTGSLAVGIQDTGSGSFYYTGFNTDTVVYTTVDSDANRAYRSSITLRWDSTIDSAGGQPGSWAVLNAVNFTIG